MTDLTIDSGGSTRCDSEWTSDGWQTESSHKLYLVESGTATYALPGHELRLAPATIYLIPGGRPHRHGSAQGMFVHWLHFHMISPVVERRLARIDRIISWPAGQWSWWQPVWHSIPAWIERRDLAGELRLQALVAAVLAEVLETEGADPPPDPRLVAALRWMEVQCLKHPSLVEAARVAGFAPAVFNRKFSAAFGTTPRRWLELSRLSHARRLLREPGATVQGVAAACGYANPFHFSRVISRRFGLSPVQLRAKEGP